MEAYGAPASITSFVVPTGYSFNLDGSNAVSRVSRRSLLPSCTVLTCRFVAESLVLTLMVTSKGIAGVPGVSFVVLLATLGSVGFRWKVWRLSPALTVSSIWRVPR